MTSSSETNSPRGLLISSIRSYMEIIKHFEIENHDIFWYWAILEMRTDFEFKGHNYNEGKLLFLNDTLWFYIQTLRKSTKYGIGCFVLLYKLMIDIKETHELQKMNHWMNHPKTDLIIELIKDNFIDPFSHIPILKELSDARNDHPNAPFPPILFPKNHPEIEVSPRKIYFQSGYCRGLPLETILYNQLSQEANGIIAGLCAASGGYMQKKKKMSQFLTEKFLPKIMEIEEDCLLFVVQILKYINVIQKSPQEIMGYLTSLNMYFVSLYKFFTERTTEKEQTTNHAFIFFFRNLIDFFQEPKK